MLHYEPTLTSSEGEQPMHGIGTKRTADTDPENIIYLAKHHMLLFKP